jgi:hypothetical protein
VYSFTSLPLYFCFPFLLSTLPFLFLRPLLSSQFSQVPTLAQYSRQRRSTEIYCLRIARRNTAWNMGITTTPLYASKMCKTEETLSQPHRTRTSDFRLLQIQNVANRGGMHTVRNVHQLAPTFNSSWDFKIKSGSSSREMPGIVYMFIWDHQPFCVSQLAGREAISSEARRISYCSFWSHCLRTFENKTLNNIFTSDRK